MEESILGCCFWNLLSLQFPTLILFVLLFIYSRPGRVAVCFEIWLFMTDDIE
jgi:hypothetical protein